MHFWLFDGNPAKPPEIPVAIPGRRGNEIQTANNTIAQLQLFRAIGGSF